jgi:hypothetical protein
LVFLKAKKPFSKHLSRFYLKAIELKYFFTAINLKKSSFS